VHFSAATTVVIFDGRHAPALLRQHGSDSVGAARERVRLAISCEVRNTAHRLEQTGARVFSEAELDRLLEGDEVIAAAAELLCLRPRFHGCRSGSRL
jgi:hypothetical protein